MFIVDFSNGQKTYKYATLFAYSLSKFELTPKQKGLLESLASETGKAIFSLLDEALEGRNGI